MDEGLMVVSNPYLNDVAHGTAACGWQRAEKSAINICDRCAERLRFGGKGSVASLFR